MTRIELLSEHLLSLPFVSGRFTATSSKQRQQFKKVNLMRISWPPRAPKHATALPRTTVMSSANRRLKGNQSILLHDCRHCLQS